VTDEVVDELRMRCATREKILRCLREFVDRQRRRRTPNRTHELLALAYRRLIPLRPLKQPVVLHINCTNLGRSPSAYNRK